MLTVNGNNARKKLTYLTLADQISKQISIKNQNYEKVLVI